MTYSPALTLFEEENVVVNLGERPFKFPVLRSKPIIDSPIVLINYFRRLEKNIIALIDSQISINKMNVSSIYTFIFEIIFKTLVTSYFQTKNSLKHYDKIKVNNVVKNILFHQFEHLLKNQFIIDSCFILFLNNLNKRSPQRLIIFFELMWEIVPVSYIFFTWYIIIVYKNKIIC